MALKNSINPNEEVYPNGKKPFTSVIKNSGDGNLLIWRQPEEDFNNNSILIVEPGEEAIFVNNGRIEEVFSCGRYKLHSKNYPFLSRLQMRSHGGISAYNCLVYFVRKAHSQEIRWGTDSPIRVRDKVMGIATTLGAYGSYKVQIDNPSLFLEKLIGNNVAFEKQEGLNKYFSSEFQSKIKSQIAQYIEESEREILGIDARLEEISNIILPKIREVLSAYGLLCITFSIASINIADDELRKEYDKAFISRHQKVVDATGEKEVLNILEDDWGRIQSKELLSKIAENPTGGIATAGAGLGMGVAAGGMFANLASQAFTPMSQAQSTPPRGSGRFSSESVTPVSEPSNASEQEINFEEALEILKRSLDKGYITQEDFDIRKKEILDKLTNSVKVD